MTTQEINTLIICAPLVLICLFAVGLIIHNRREEKGMA